MVQLWVNLPMKDKMTTPGYQSITHDVIPTVTLPDDAGVVRVIAGRYEETKGPAHTFSPLNVWDMRLQRNRQLTLAQPEGWSTGAGGTERQYHGERHDAGQRSATGGVEPARENAAP
ncbi:pirin-like protein [Salmonella enterica subsp. enterica]|uniref:Pirin-like protein n=1 Tax=Salmonella enterica I TaxID=59201 RepID=A0A379WXN8_SALET|nr:pirin-like protein [Salmonella enterica subsp. enterica]